MTQADELIQKAADILQRFQVGRHMGDMLTGNWKYKSVNNIEFDRNPNLDDFQEQVESAIRCRRGDDWVLLGLTDFRTSAVPDDDDSYATAYLYFNGDLVLETSASKSYRDYVSDLRIHTYPSSIKAFKAGPWLDLLGECATQLEVDYKERVENDRQKRVADQASKIDLGNYE